MKETDNMCPKKKEDDSPVLRIAKMKRELAEYKTKSKERQQKPVTAMLTKVQRVKQKV